MATRNLAKWLDGEQDRLVWIEFDDYAHRVFAGDSPDWLNIANVFVGGVGQALGVVATEVLSIDLLAAYRIALERSEASPADTIETMLGQDIPQQFVGQVIDALAHRYGDRMDLVVKIPSPAQLLRLAGLQDPPSFDDLDDVGIGLSNLLREFSARPIAGVLIATSEPISSDEAEALESVVSVARHYEWRVALSLDSASTVPGELPEVDMDLLLLPALGHADIAADTALSLPIGGGLGADYWQGDTDIPVEPHRALFYGTIPPDTQPERVVKRVADTRP